ncbi:MAG: single-stranded DNA-binding protein [Janthinobacterium lividum]
MAYSLNKVSLIGNLGKDPEIRNTKEGKEIATLAIATSESWKDRNTGEKTEKTEWHKVVIFNEALVGIIKGRVKKGTKLFLEGSLQTRKWTDDSGQDRYTTEVVLQNFNSSLIILDKNVSESADTPYSDRFNPYGKEENSNNSNHNSDNMDLDDEMPF